MTAIQGEPRECPASLKLIASKMQVKLVRCDGCGGKTLFPPSARHWNYMILGKERCTYCGREAEAQRRERNRWWKVNPAAYRQQSKSRKDAAEHGGSQSRGKKDRRN